MQLNTLIAAALLVASTVQAAAVGPQVRHNLAKGDSAKSKHGGSNDRLPTVTGTAIVPLASLGAGVRAQPGGTRNTSSNQVPIPARLVRNPDYAVKSNWDYQSIALAAHQEDIERALFEHMLARFSIAEYNAAGLNETDLALIRWMAEQEVNHKQAFRDMLGRGTPGACTYRFPFDTVAGALEYAEINTRYGESGTIGWIPLLDNPASGNIVIQAITTESRQEYTFRQWRGQFPMPVAFEPAIPQPYHWTLLSRDIVACPSNNTPLAWPILPRLRVLNQPVRAIRPPRITQKSSQATAPGRRIYLSWDAPGQKQGPYDQHTQSAAGKPRYALFISQLNATAVPLEKVSLRDRTAEVVQPGGVVFPFTDQSTLGQNNNVINGTVFISIIDDAHIYTPNNLTLLPNHTVAGPEVYFSG